MKAILVEKFGGPEVLQMQDIPVPLFGDNDVLVRLAAAGVNPVDAYIRSGTYARLPALPYTPGMDGAGVIEAVGKNVSGVQVGERVYLSGSKSGTYAEIAVSHQSQVHPLPDHLTFEQGAALGIPYATAWCAFIVHAAAKPGQTVLIHGATGGVGLAALQIASMMKLTVIATGGTSQGRDLLHKQGARFVFDHHAPGYREEILSVNCGRGPNIILEMAAHINLDADLRLIARRGTIVIIGSRGEITINPRDAMSRDAHIVGMTLFNRKEQELEAIHANIGDGLRKQHLHPVISRSVPLQSASAAHEIIAAGGAVGKVVIEI